GQRLQTTDLVHTYEVRLLGYTPISCGLQKKSAAFERGAMFTPTGFDHWLNYKAALWPFLLSVLPGPERESCLDCEPRLVNLDLTYDELSVGFDLKMERS
ncbi:hypothetical protein IRJ41_020864, partial [Triplophysa rosa]